MLRHNYKYVYLSAKHLLRFNMIYEKQMFLYDKYFNFIKCQSYDLGKFLNLLKIETYF